MRRTEWIATALGAVLMAAPAQAQRAGDTVQEMQRERGNAAVPSVPRQKQASAMVDRSAAGGDPTAWVEQAQDALRRNRLGEANEMLERAETRMLSRSTPASMADQPMSGPAIRHITAARSALMGHDRRTAAQEAEQALTALRSMPPGDMMSGGNAGAMPMQGGGSLMLRDGGMAGTSMSRADLILAQGTGGGGSGGAGGGLSAGTPGSPAAGNLGSTPQEMLGRSQQPAQGAAAPLVPNQGRGAPDPSASPGRMQTAPGGTGNMPGDTTRR